jgi:energy-coupling factor transporter ATP-binding protein EcfA2
VPDPLTKYREDVKELIKGRCGDGVVLLLSPPLTHIDRLASELESELGKGKVRHYIIGSEGGKERVKRLVKILKDVRGSMTSDKGYVVDERLMKELRDLLGDEWVGDVRPDCVIPYYIPWEEARKYASDKDVDERVRNALKLIINGFEGKGGRITWFGLDYVPEELVEDVMGAKDKDVVKRWIDDYLDIVSKLGLDEENDNKVRRVLRSLKELVRRSSDVVKALLSLLKVSEPYAQVAAVALSFITASLSDKRDAVGEVVDVLTRFRDLSKDGELSVLGKLIAHKLAVRAELDYESVHIVLVSISGLSNDELRNIASGIAERVKEVEEKLRIIIEIKGWSKENRFEVYDDFDFEIGKAYPGILVKDDELMIRGSITGESVLETHKIVVTEGFTKLRDEVLRRLSDKGVVVLVGPRGIGKSTLATYAIWTLFKENKLTFVVNVKNLEDKGSEFWDFIGLYITKYWSNYGDLLLVYDPSTTKTYSEAERKVDVPPGVSKTLDILLSYIVRDEGVRSKARLLIVLPTDIYQALPSDQVNELSNYVINLEERGILRDPEFLAAVIREYAKGCSIDYDKMKESADEITRLADKIQSKFEKEGYTLIARLAGTLIANKYGCRVNNVERIIEESRGNAHYFILQYVNSLFKVHEEPDMAKALVEVFALRRPFVDKMRPGDPILTPGIVELIGNNRDAKTLYSAKGKELRNWLAHRQHDLIEEAIKKLLKCIVSGGEECKELGDAVEPWKETIGVRELLMEVSEKVSDVGSAVEYFVGNYGEKLTNTLKVFSNECWKRAALIIGHALAGIPTVPRLEDLSAFLPEDLRKSVVESLGDALKGCGVDYYLLVGDKIPPIIIGLIIIGLAYTLAFAWAFIDRYNEAVAEVRRVRDTVRDMGISVAEGIYGLGLASIIVKAVESGKPIEPGDADAVLSFALSTIQRVALPGLITPILYALRPLRGKAPQRYIELLAAASSMTDLDSDTVKYILSELSYVLSNYGDVVRGYAWSLVHAIIAYAEPLSTYLGYFNSEEIGDMVGRVVDLLKKLGKFNSKLGVIGWADALTPALEHEYVRGLMEEKLGIDVVGKASEVLEELNDMRERVQELMRDEVFMSYIESWSVKADEEAVKIVIRKTAVHLKYALAHYRLDNNELDKARDLFNEVYKELREIGEYENYLVARTWALRVGAIKGSLVGKELVDGFRQLYEETFKEPFEYTAPYPYLSTASSILCDYLVSLALTGDDKKISKLLEEHWWVLNANKEVSVLTRLMLNALLGPRGGLSGELEGKLAVNPEELIDALVQLNAPSNPIAQLALMLHSLINGNKELPKAYALEGAVSIAKQLPTGKLPTRLFLEAYKECCDLESESFRLALARLFFYHI